MIGNFFVSDPSEFEAWSLKLQRRQDIIFMVNSKRILLSLVNHKKLNARYYGPYAIVKEINAQPISYTYHHI